MKYTEKEFVEEKVFYLLAMHGYYRKDITEEQIISILEIIHWWFWEMSGDQYLIAVQCLRYYQENEDNLNKSPNRQV